MQSRHFMLLTRNLSHRLSRRSALVAGAGIGGIAAVEHRHTTAQETTPVASPENGVIPSWLVIQRFAGAELSPSPDGTILILEGVEPTALAFTDRPAHLARFISSTKAWTWANDSTNPPNATFLALPAEGGGEVAVVVELLETHYDETTGQMTATVLLLGEGNLGALDLENAQSKEQRFGAGHIFIDDIGDDTDDCCVLCDSSPDYFRGRFQGCFDGGMGDCNACAEWVNCRGGIATDSCGTVASNCSGIECY